MTYFIKGTKEKNSSPDKINAHTINNPNEKNYSAKETKGILKKYEMGKLNKYVIITTLALINIATWLLIHKIIVAFSGLGEDNIMGHTLVMLGITVGIFTITVLYFNQKTNLLLDERSKQLKKVSRTL